MKKNWKMYEDLLKKKNKKSIKNFFFSLTNDSDFDKKVDLVSTKVIDVKDFETHVNKKEACDRRELLEFVYEMKNKEKNKTRKKCFYVSWLIFDILYLIILVLNFLLSLAF